MEEAAELANYLPLSFKTPKEQEYIDFLWDAFETNCKHSKYQFAFLAYHMLTLSFVYFPLSFKTPKEQEYIDFLWDAFETNCKHSKYQFAFLAYHMLTMSFVYFN